jgi:hypothetical protein
MSTGKGKNEPSGIVPAFRGFKFVADNNYITSVIRKQLTIVSENLLKLICLKPIKKPREASGENAAHGCKVPTAGLEPARAIRPNRF